MGAASPLPNGCKNIIIIIIIPDLYSPRERHDAKNNRVFISHASAALQNNE